MALSASSSSIGSCRHVSAFEKVGRIGEGTYGIVYKAVERASGTPVALKRVRMDGERDGLPITSLREIKILKSLEHPNIVKLLDVVVDEDPQSVFLVFEYVEHDLGRLIDSAATSTSTSSSSTTSGSSLRKTMGPTFSESEVKCLLRQLLEGIAYLHDNWVLHRDLKLSNLLFSNRGELKLCDFGLARVFAMPRRDMTPNVVTLWYRAPELLFGAKSYSASLDMWSVGCIFGELLLDEPLLPGRNEMEQIKLCCELLGSPTEKIWPGFDSLPVPSKVKLPIQPYNNLSTKLPFLSKHGLDLLNQMLTYDPDKRITARQALSHRYFKEKPLPSLPDLMPTFPVHASHDGRSSASASRRPAATSTSSSSSSTSTTSASTTLPSSNAKVLALKRKAAASAAAAAAASSSLDRIGLMFGDDPKRRRLL